MALEQEHGLLVLSELVTKDQGKRTETETQCSQSSQESPFSWKTHENLEL